MNPTQSKSIRSGLPHWFPTALAASSSRACPKMLAWAAFCLFAIPGVSRADSVQDWTVTGTVDWGTARTVTRYFTVGITSSAGTLNQTNDTITSTWGGVLVGQVFSAGVTATWNMSGAAQYNSGTSGFLLGNSLASTAVATWSLTDTASATIGTLSFGQANQASGSRCVLLSGAASITATSLAFNNKGTVAGNMNYISFATGSTASFTAGDKSFSDYQCLVTAGNIRVDGVVQTDFSQFQVSGHCLTVTDRSTALLLCSYGHATSAAHRAPLKFPWLISHHFATFFPRLRRNI